MQYFVIKSHRSLPAFPFSLDLEARQFWREIIASSFGPESQTCFKARLRCRHTICTNQDNVRQYYLSLTQMLKKLICLKVGCLNDSIVVIPA